MTEFKIWTIGQKQLDRVIDPGDRLSIMVEAEQDFPSMTTKIAIRNKITQSNKLTEATYSLTRDQKRILYLCMAKLPLNIDEDQIEHNGEFVISVAEYAHVYDLPSSTASQDIRRALNAFRGREVTIYRPEFDMGDEKGFDAYAWLTKRSARPSIGQYQLSINPALIPLMTGLKRDYTSYGLFDVKEINHPLVQRLYETMCQYRGNRTEGTVVLEVDWIRKRYDLPASYNKIQDFKRYFLNVAIKEINEKTPMRLTVEERKRGRVITTLVFHFTVTEPRRGITIDGELTNMTPISGESDLQTA